MKQKETIVKGVLLILSLGCAGCVSAGTKPHGLSVQNLPPIKEKSDAEALKSVVGAISGGEIGDRDLGALGVQLKKDPEAKEAVESISDSLLNNKPKVKYCPITGKRYSPRLKKCPIHDVPLKEVEP